MRFTCPAKATVGWAPNTRSEATRLKTIAGFGTAIIGECEVIQEKMKALTTGLILVAASTVALHAHAQSNPSVHGSEAISVGTLSVLTAPVASVAGSAGNGGPAAGGALASIGGFYVISGIVDVGGDSVEVMLNAVKGAGKLSAKIAKSALHTVGASVGATVEVSAVATGTLLVASGKVLAFIPNTVGEALLHHSRVPGESS